MRQTLCIIVLFAISASTLSHATLSPTPPSWHKCKTQHNESEDILKDLRLNPEKLFKDPTKRCFVACILIENKTVKSDGTLNLVTLIENMPKNIFEREKVAAAFTACANETGVDVCETAYKTVECMNGKDEIRNIHPIE